jgi:DNA-binding HxlR family transcriptional regulator
MPADCTIDGDESPICYCPLSGVVELLGRKYTMQIVCVVGAHEPVRFGAIEDHVPTASTSTLSSRLEALVDAGLLDREQHDEIPPRVEYSLTDDGRELQTRLEPLLAWASERG